MRSGGNEFIGEIMQFHAVGMTPPVTMGFLAMKGDEFLRQQRQRTRKANGIPALGPVFGPWLHWSFMRRT